MKKGFNLLFKDKLILFSFIISFILFSISTVAVSFFYQNFPPLVPIFNSMPWGEKRLAPTFVLFLFPVLFFVVLLINNVLAYFFYTRYTLASRILSASAFLFVLLGFIAFLQIFFLIF